MTPISPIRFGPVATRDRSSLTTWPLDAAAVRLAPLSHLGRWQELNGAATIPHSIEMIEASGSLGNFRRVLDPSLGAYVGFNFADSDVYKVLEAVAWEIARTGAHAFDAFLDATVNLLGAVQRRDGYLNSHIQGNPLAEPFADLRWGHELYCIGHLIQAGVALSRGTGRDDLMAIARRAADLIVRRNVQRGQPDVCGHPEIETALVELYRATGHSPYLDLAAAMIDARGVGVLGPDRLGAHYFQDHVPVRESSVATGHAVRQLYLNAGVTDVYIERGDPRLLRAIRGQWANAHERKMYLTGAMGSRHFDESFGDDYELPPDRAYAETCASIADIQWTWRLTLVQRDARLADAIERTLLNSVASAVSADGRAFFYSNPLHLRAGHREEENAPSRRTPWYGCACCPPNIARLVASLHTYVASAGVDELTVHQYAAGTIEIPPHLGSGTLAVRTDYPHGGRVEISLDGKLRTGAGLALRIPGWARSWAATVDGRPVDWVPGADGYLVLDPVGEVTLDLPMAAKAVAAHPRVDAVRGAVAIVRGPVVYCVEQADHAEDVPIDDLRLPVGAQITVGAPGPGGLPFLHAEALLRAPDAGPLYRCSPADNLPTHQAPAPRAVRLTAIPYAAWGNRAAGAMRVWLPTVPAERAPHAPSRSRA